MSKERENTKNWRGKGTAEIEKARETERAKERKKEREKEKKDRKKKSKARE